jgi:hypothetical protein
MGLFTVCLFSEQLATSTLALVWPALTVAMPPIELFYL